MVYNFRQNDFNIKLKSIYIHDKENDVDVPLTKNTVDEGADKLYFFMKTYLINMHSMYIIGDATK